MRNHKQKKSITVRYAFLAISFAVICVAFVITLAVIQIKGPQTEYSGDKDETVRKWRKP